MSTALSEMPLNVVSPLYWQSGIHFYKTKAARVGAGVTSEKELLSPENKVHPDYYTDSLPDLLSVKQALKA